MSTLLITPSVLTALPVHAAKLCVPYVQDPVALLKLQEATDDVRRRMACFKADYLAIGAQFIEVKAMLPHGEWGRWLRFEFDLSERTAQRFMNAAQMFADKSDTVSDLPPSVVYALAAPSLPEELRNDFLVRIEAGARPAVKDVTKEAAEHRRANPTWAASKKKLRKAAASIAPIATKPTTPTESDEREVARRVARLIREAMQEDQLRELYALLRKTNGFDLHSELQWSLSGYAKGCIECVTLDE